MRCSVGWTAFALSFVAVTLAGCKNPLDAFAECPGYRTTVDAGTAVQSVDPAMRVAPILGTSDGVITWTASSTTSPVHVTLARASDPITSSWNDCPDPPQLTGFEVPIAVHVVSDDALLDVSGSSLVYLDASGNLSPQSLSFSLPAADAGSAFEDPDASGAFVTITIVLAGDGAAGLAAGSVARGSTTIATIAFGP